MPERLLRGSIRESEDAGETWEKLEDVGGTSEAFPPIGLFGSDEYHALYGTAKFWPSYHESANHHDLVLTKHASTSSRTPIPVSVPIERVRPTNRVCLSDNLLHCSLLC